MEFVILFFGLFAFLFGIWGMSTLSDEMEDDIREYIAKKKKKKHDRKEQP